MTDPVRFSTLKQMSRSPAHALYSQTNPYEPTLAMRLGSGVHSLLLGGPPVLEWTGKQRRGKEYDAWLADHPPDAIVLLAKDFARSHAIANAVRGNDDARRVLLAPGMRHEQTILWEQNGRARRSTPDARDSTILTDLKTCRTADPQKFTWDAIRMGYHAQLADYAAAFEADCGVPPHDVYIVAVEQNAPHAVTVHRLTAGALERGGKMARTWLAQFVECERTGVWPGYAAGVVDFEVPLEESDLIFADEEPTE